MSDAVEIAAIAAAAPGDMAAAIRAVGRLAAAGDPGDPAAWLDLLRLLYAVGRRDLPLGRLSEGHVDALQIVARYGPPGRAAALKAAGATLGVWNADLPGTGLRIDGGRLAGGKAFASGAGILSHALVTADTDAGRQLVLVDLARVPPVIDRDWWRTIGMQRSETHLVRWHDATIGAAIDAGDLIGAGGDYAREPWFSNGALRFAAVQAGGVAALFDATRDHLVAAGRDADPHQAGAVRRAADASGGDAARAYVASARMQVAEAGDRAIAVAQQAVGVAGLFTGHPLSAIVADLSVYLRQPGPDAQRMAVSRAAADGRIAPGL